MTEEEYRIVEMLDDLRESGVTNMMGAVPYIMEDFPDLSQKQARDYLMKWIQGEL